MPRPTTALIVDDEAPARKYLRVLLAELGFVTCWEAEDGVQALEMFEAHRPELVLLDVNLRATTGLQVLQWLERNHPGWPVIMLSSEEAVATVDEAMRLGATAYLVKHLTTDEAFKKLSEILDGLGAKKAKPGGAPR